MVWLEELVISDQSYLVHTENALFYGCRRDAISYILPQGIQKLEDGNVYSIPSDLNDEVNPSRSRYRWY